MYMLNLDKTKKYLLACSYGPDSMALFDMLLKEEYKFSVAHVNYHKRDISNFEEESMRDICLKNNIPYQFFTNKSDIRGGSTLGNISNTHVSLKSCDIGLGQLAMHSSFETAGAEDILYLYNFIKNFYL